MNAAELLRIMPLAGAKAQTVAAPLTDAMREFWIATPKQQAAFLAQLAHESGQLRYSREIADGSAYEGRTDLGNTQPGDGKRFPGRAWMQVTGRENYRLCGVALNMDLINEPQLLEQIVPACRGSGWYWQSRNLNALADIDAFGALTKKINGGYNGLDERIGYWLRAREVLGVK